MLDGVTHARSKRPACIQVTAGGAKEKKGDSVNIVYENKSNTGHNRRHVS